MQDPGAIGSQVPPGPDEVGKRIKALESQVQQALAAAASAQALIALANAQLALAANQVVPQVGSAGSSSYLLTTSFQTLASFTFTTPTGYTRAVVTASGAATMLSNTASGEFGYARVVIGGAAGQEGRFSFNAPSTAPSVPAFSSQIFTGLTSGQTILVEIQARLINGPGFSLSITQSGSVSGMALFQK